jgi:hypothetical protein
MPSTGELVIADQATASLIRTSAVNFGVVENKLREVMAERLLITAAYRGSRTVVSPPQLFSSHSTTIPGATTSGVSPRSLPLWA